MIKDELRHLRTGERRCQEVGSAAADDTPLRPMSGTSSRVLWGKRTLLSQALSLGTGRIPQAQWQFQDEVINALHPSVCPSALRDTSIDQCLTHSLSTYICICVILPDSLASCVST